MELFQPGDIEAEKDQGEQCNGLPVEQMGEEDTRLGKGLLPEQQAHLGHRQKARRGDEGGGGGAQAVKDGVHGPALAEFLEKAGDDQDDLYLIYRKNTEK